MEMKSEKLQVCECDVEKKKKETEPVHVVLQVDLHCDGCIARIVRLARRLEGVETVRADPVSNKLTLIGFMDPVKTAEKLQKKTKKKIELLSPKPKKETKVNNDAKAETKTTMIAVSTVNLKLSCSCDGCIKRIHKTISKTKGVYQVKIDREKEVVSVTGTMEVKTVTETLKRKLKKTIQAVPEKKDKKKENAEENSKSAGSPGLPCYGFNYGLGHYGFIGGPITELFSEEDPNSCCVM
ncbi:Heavy metal-associated isoprenylated plant protein 1 [Hirschfeldia incana]|nr:Heavy metal-associated isoprenylated plant protein 1 [Hirschfeldia incana]